MNRKKKVAALPIFETLVQPLPDIIFKIDPKGNFTFRNDSIQSLGYEKKELMGKHFSIILLKEDLRKISRTEVQIHLDKLKLEKY